MEVYEVWEQWPRYQIATFYKLGDAQKFVAENRSRFALPIVVGHVVNIYNTPVGYVSY